MNAEGSADCSLMRAYQLRYLPHRTANDAKHAIEDTDNALTPTTQTITINGLTVVKYTGVGLCAYPTLEVVGQTYNYEFSTSCGTGSQEEWDELTNIVKSVTLIK